MVRVRQEAKDAEATITSLDQEQILASDEHKRLAALAEIMAEEEAEAARVAEEQRSRRLLKLAKLHAERRDVEQMLEAASAEAIDAENELKEETSEADDTWLEAHAITVQYQTLLEQRTNAIAALARERDEARAQLRAARLALIEGVEVDNATLVSRGGCSSPPPPPPPPPAPPPPLPRCPSVRTSASTPSGRSWRQRWD